MEWKSFKEFLWVFLIFVVACQNPWNFFILSRKGNGVVSFPFVLWCNLFASQNQSCFSCQVEFYVLHFIYTAVTSINSLQTFDWKEEELKILLLGWFELMQSYYGDQIFETTHIPDRKLGRAQNKFIWKSSHCHNFHFILSFLNVPPFLIIFISINQKQSF